jgi:hypothetical protein
LDDARIKDLQANAIPGRVNPELQQLVTERSQLAKRRDEANREFLDLAKEKRPGSENLAQIERPRTKETPHGNLPVIATRAQRDALRSGQKYVAPNGEIMTKK